MNDFLSWFLLKHWLISAVMFPEVAFAFAIWERWYWWSCVPFAMWIARKFL